MSTVDIGDNAAGEVLSGQFNLVFPLNHIIFHCRPSFDHFPPSFHTSPTPDLIRPASAASLHLLVHASQK